MKTPYDEPLKREWNKEDTIHFKGAQGGWRSCARAMLPSIKALKRLVERHDEEPPMLTGDDWQAARDAIKQLEETYGQYIGDE